MKYLPFENITYKTKLEPEEILKRLRNHLEPKKMFRKRGIFKKETYKAYEGTIDGSTFSINRIIAYKNSFAPRINGTITKGINRTEIKVKMRLHPFVYFFMVIWISFLAVFGLVFLNISDNINNPQYFSYLPFGMLLFGYILATGGFKYESIKSKKFFTELFEVDHVEN